MLAIRAGFATSCTHTESRISSLIGHGFYTIGPCGEENLVRLAARGAGGRARLCLRARARCVGPPCPRHVIMVML
jgi:hypothetical protein